jgi:competence protein ComEA
MNAPPSPLGVATELTDLPPDWPGDAQWVDLPADVSVTIPAPVGADGARAAWWALAALSLLALGLLGSHLHATMRRSAQPAALESGTVTFAVDLNRADHAQLLQLPGVGENLATRIEAYRREHGDFRDVGDLRHVSGIGPALLAKLRPVVCVEPTDRDDEPEALPTPPPGQSGTERKEKPGDGGKAMGGKKIAEPASPINVNTAPEQELQRLPGIGPALGARIIAARGKAPFKTIDDLRRVPGIGPKTLDKLRPFVTVESEP